MLFLDGVYAEDARGKRRFYRVKAPTQEALLTSDPPRAHTELEGDSYRKHQQPSAKLAHAQPDKVVDANRTK